MPPSGRDVEMSTFVAKEDSLAHGSSWSTRGGAAPGRDSLYYDDNNQGPSSSSRHNSLGSAIRTRVAQWVDSFRPEPADIRITPPIADPAYGRRRSSGYGYPRPSGSYRVGSVVPADIGEDLGLGMAPSATRGQDGLRYDLRAANMGTASSMLARELKGRHLQMIAIGGSIGTGLFVASGKALYLGGPGSVLIAYMIIGVMLFCTMQALGELAVAFPVSGSFSAFSTRFLDPSWGFAMGWNYALNWIAVLPLEIIAASITIGYWNSSLDRAIFVTLFLVTIIAINLFGVKGYGEAEFVFAIIKVTAVIGFILLGIVINIGGNPGEGYIGGKFWHSPGAFHNGFKGLCSVFVTAAFAFAGTELVGLAAAETANPRKSLPTAIKQVFWRITLFYVVALAVVGLLVPYTEPKLLGAKSIADASASPFVIAIESAGIEILPSVMNTVILVAVMSVGNSAVFGSSRTIAALADQRQAPRVLGYIDRRGRPVAAILLASAVGFLAYLADAGYQASVLEWLLAIASLSSIFTWGSICLAHIRFRKAWALAGRRPSQLAFRAQAGVAGSWVGLILTVLVLAGQFWVAAWPLPDDGVETKASSWGTVGQTTQNFFLKYMTAPIVLVCYVVHKAVFRTRVVRLEEIDVDTGRRDFNLPILLAQEMDEKRAWPRWKKLYRMFC